MSINDQLIQVKHSSYTLAQLTDYTRNEVLRDLANNIVNACTAILAANTKDLADMAQNDPRLDRLLLTEERIYSIDHDIETVIALPSPLDLILEQKQLANGLQIRKVSVPLGVVAVIYEARPNVTVDVFSLCFKSGNACILKGGKEAQHTNQILAAIIHQTLLDHNINPHVFFALSTDRAETLAILQAVNLIDVCIPRGGQELINFVRANAKIPIIETGAGIVHAFVDYNADLPQAKAIIENSKTRRVSVCNALDCLIIHQQLLENLASILEPLIQQNVEIYADEASYQQLYNKYPDELLHKAKPEDFGQEFLDYKLAIKTVTSVAEAVQHIMHYTSGHSEAILSQDQDNIDYFQAYVDAAVIYVNASTAFTDGAQFGMGSEVGISTQKLHARGPMGLAALTSYKWIVHGIGNIRK